MNNKNNSIPRGENLSADVITDVRLCEVKMWRAKTTTCLFHPSSHQEQLLSRLHLIPELKIFSNKCQKTSQLCLLLIVFRKESVKKKPTFTTHWQKTMQVDSIIFHPVHFVLFNCQPVEALRKKRQPVNFLLPPFPVCRPISARLARRGRADE